MRKLPVRAFWYSWYWTWRCKPLGSDQLIIGWEQSLISPLLDKFPKHDTLYFTTYCVASYARVSTLQFVPRATWARNLHARYHSGGACNTSELGYLSVTSDMMGDFLSRCTHAQRNRLVLQICCPIAVTHTVLSSSHTGRRQIHSPPPFPPSIIDFPADYRQPMRNLALKIKMEESSVRPYREEVEEKKK